MKTSVRTVMYVSGLVIALGVGSSAHQAVATADDHGPMFKLVDDAAQRLLTADPVAASKYLTRGAVDDPTREQQVLDSVDGWHVPTMSTKTSSATSSAIKSTPPTPLNTDSSPNGRSDRGQFR